MVIGRVIDIKGVFMKKKVNCDLRVVDTDPIKEKVSSDLEQEDPQSDIAKSSIQKNIEKNDEKNK